MYEVSVKEDLKLLSHRNSGWNNRGWNVSVKEDLKLLSHIYGASIARLTDVSVKEDLKLLSHQGASVNGKFKKFQSRKI
ncbi:hypothetical protein SAMN05444277_102154 [Parafilimonas terrae]|uniref:Uncharacterized protein n=1 Tax=Parafilimonas terrae TaxID=1465490 RepID=A0A1I5TIQ0_9BACT|nr:hypothetical protein SAMN05444277_102154 [Parafilimonas terrae]